MPRTVAEIDKEMADLSAKGVHHASKEMRVLRDERTALIEVEKPKAEITQPPSAPMPGFERATEAKSESQDELDFIDRCIVEVELANDGNQTRLAKNLYQQITAQVRIRRIFRVLFADIGPGGEFPAWKSLGLQDGTGLPVPPEPAPVPLRPPQVVIPAQGAHVNGGGIDPASLAALIRQEVQKASDPVEQMKRGIGNLVGGDVSARPEPSRKAVPVGA